MKVHLIKRLSIDKFAESNPASGQPFANWLNVLRVADWNKPQDM